MTARRQTCHAQFPIDMFVLRPTECGTTDGRLGPQSGASDGCPPTSWERGQEKSVICSVCKLASNSGESCASLAQSANQYLSLAEAACLTRAQLGLVSRATESKPTSILARIAETTLVYPHL